MSMSSRWNDFCKTMRKNLTAHEIVYYGSCLKERVAPDEIVQRGFGLLPPQHPIFIELAENLAANQEVVALFFFAARLGKPDRQKRSRAYRRRRRPRGLRFVSQLRKHAEVFRYCFNDIAHCDPQICSPDSLNAMRVLASHTNDKAGRALSIKGATGFFV